MIKLNEVKNFKSFIKTTIAENIELKLQTNSSSCDSQSTFLAIKGERFNALKFLDQVTQRGTKYLVFENKGDNLELVAPFEDKLKWIIVSDAVKFLQEFSRLISKKIQSNNGFVIGISGSNGKTTTREMLYHLLSKVEKHCISTEKNNNNHIGVPLTLLQADNQTKIAIVELGSNHPGEIKVLCQAADPNLGVTTNIGHTHLEFFSSIDEVFKEEGYLAVYLHKKNKLFFKNEDDRFLRTLTNTTVKSFGHESNDCNFTFSENSLTIKYDSKVFSISNGNITGQHNFFNLGVAFILSLQVAPERSKDLLQACESFKPTDNRSEWKKIHNTHIFLDAYNANPSSMIASAQGFISSLPTDAKALFIVGDMNELGEKTEQLHYEVALKFNELKVSDITYVGRFFEGFKKGFDGNLSIVKSVEDIGFNLKDYTHVFIKGSRSLQLERILDIT